MTGDVPSANEAMATEWLAPKLAPPGRTCGLETQSGVARD